jgi:Ca2+-binding RTX toxin-like protein
MCIRLDRGYDKSQGGEVTLRMCLLDGGVGVDRLNGGKGNDVLLDYYGGDRLTGGQGKDIFGVGGALSQYSVDLKRRGDWVL